LEEQDDSVDSLANAQTTPTGFIAGRILSEEGRTLRATVTLNFACSPANLVNAVGSVTWRLHAQYRDSRGTTSFDQYYPTGPPTVYPEGSPAGSPWSITASTGGTVTVLWALNGASQNSFSFNVNGANANPTHSALLGSLGNSPWYLPFVPGAESSYRQFDSNGIPFWGFPDGYGVMQIDSASGVTLRLNLLYNWQDNADEGRSELQAKAQLASNWWDSQKQQWQAYNAGKPTQQQFPLPPDYFCGNAGTSARPNYLCNTDPAQVPGARCKLTAQDPPPAGSRHFRDGITLKRYNGATGGDFMPGLMTSAG
jgi:hypothetical protein